MVTIRPPKTIVKGVTLILTPRGHCQLRIGTTLSRVVTSAL